MIYREMKVQAFCSDLRSIRLAKKGKTQVGLCAIKFDLQIRIGNFFSTCVFDFFHSLQTNTSKSATQSSHLFHDKSYNIDF